MSTIALNTQRDALKKRTAYKRKTREDHVISPDVAEAWLTKNVSNRKLYKNHVRRLAIAMKGGLWKEDDSPIRFDWDGNLFDGQHRLHACIRAGVPFKSLVIYGYDPEMRYVVDSGRPRSPGDNLAIAGHINTTNLAAATRILIHEINGTSLRNSDAAPTTEQIQAFVSLHPKLPQYIYSVRTLPRGITVSMASVIWFIEGTILGNAETAGEISDVFRNGIPSYEGCPLHKWRERMLATGYANRNDSWNALKMSYNKWRAGDAMSMLRLPSGVTSVKIEDLERSDLTRASVLFDALEKDADI